MTSSRQGSAEPTILATGCHLRFVKAGGWEYVERPGVTGIAVIVAVTPGGRLLLVEQRRPPVGRVVVELPAGLSGDGEAPVGEALVETACRELLEETGWGAGRMEELASGPPSAGISSEIVTFFLATDLSPRGAGGGVGAEEIVVRELLLHEVPAWLTSRRGEGALVDPKVYAGLWLAAEYRKAP